jgi:hypothetical protein
MGQRFLFAIAAVLLVGAVGIGAFGASRGGWSLGSPRIGTTAGHGGGGMMGGYGRGTMGGYVGGMMGGYVGGMMSGYGMMGAAHAPVPAGTPTISIDQAQRSVEESLASYGGSNLALDELIEFQDNFYAIVKEKSTGTGAFELLVNRVSGAVSREPGPDMMWNAKYGMPDAGMMGGYAHPTSAMTVSKDAAGQIAQSWLDANHPGTKIESPDTFYGYYTVHFTQDGKVAGMLSVNGYSGAVWYHSWHGSFIQEKEVGS